MQHPDFRSWRLGRAAAAFALTALSGLAVAGSACGSLENAFGPYDYRVDKDKLPIVEIRHFDAGVEALAGSNHGATVAADLDYTLRAFPNHPRALVAMMRLGERDKTLQPPGTNYTIECYFIRAEEFRPHDIVVRMLYANYLNRNGRRAQAIQELAIAKGLAGDDAFSHYNLGLAYLTVQDYAEALAQAHLAETLGFPKQELKRQLVAAGKWSDPPVAAASAPEGEAKPAHE